MEIKAVLSSQYHAALKTLRQCIEECPEEMWTDPADGYAAFWRAAYHTLFFTDMYLQVNHAAFVPWVKHQEEAEDLGPFNGPNGQVPKPARVYAKDEILEYWAHVDALVDKQLEVLDLSAKECGFSWYTVNKLEHQLVNIRHIQHHAGSLSTRIRLKNGTLIKWVGKGEKKG